MWPRVYWERLRRWRWGSHPRHPCAWTLVWAAVQAVGKRTLQPTRAAFTLTPLAGNKIKHFSDKFKHVRVKVGVEPEVVMAFLML